MHDSLAYLRRLALHAADTSPAQGLLLDPAPSQAPTECVAEEPPPAISTAPAPPSLKERVCPLERPLDSRSIGFMGYVQLKTWLLTQG